MKKNNHRKNVLLKPHLQQLNWNLPYSHNTTSNHSKCFRVLISIIQKTVLIPAKALLSPGQQFQRSHTSLLDAFISPMKLHAHGNPYCRLHSINIYPVSSQSYLGCCFKSSSPALQKKKLNLVLTDIEMMLPVSQWKYLTLESGSCQGTSYKIICYVVRR